jgi:hypothetical protein
VKFRNNHKKSEGRDTKTVSSPFLDFAGDFARQGITRIVSHRKDTNHTHVRYNIVRK